MIKSGLELSALTVEAMKSHLSQHVQFVKCKKPLWARKGVRYLTYTACGLAWVAYTYLILWWGWEK